jgi:hypothetical protein
MRCYTEEVEFELEDLGDDAWQTGCPLCGDNCWYATSLQVRQHIKEVDEYLDGSVESDNPLNLKYDDNSRNARRNMSKTRGQDVS